MPVRHDEPSEPSRPGLRSTRITPSGLCGECAFIAWSEKQATRATTKAMALELPPAGE
jgi:hypothetical protein